LRIFDLHTSKASYELKVVLLHLWCVNVKTIPEFISVPLADLHIIDKLAPYYYYELYNTADRQRLVF
jgi:hypothetical protein